jgi:hypothetical protein
MQDGDDLQGLCLGPVNNQAGIDRIESHLCVGEVASPMSAVREAGEVDELLPDDRLHPVCSFLTALLFDVVSCPINK